MFKTPGYFNKVSIAMFDSKLLNCLRINETLTYNLCIIKINESLVAKDLLTNITKMNEHSNVTTFVHALPGLE